MFEMIITGVIIAGASFFLIRRYYRIFTGKKSACNCGTKNMTVKNGRLTEETGCSGCCSCCKSKDTD